MLFCKFIVAFHSGWRAPKCRNRVFKNYSSALGKNAVPRVLNVSVEFRNFAFFSRVDLATHFNFTQFTVYASLNRGNKLMLLKI